MLKFYLKYLFVFLIIFIISSLIIIGINNKLDFINCIKQNIVIICFITSSLSIFLFKINVDSNVDIKRTFFISRFKYLTLILFNLLLFIVSIGMISENTIKNNSEKNKYNELKNRQIYNTSNNVITYKYYYEKDNLLKPFIVIDLSRSKDSENYGNIKKPSNYIYNEGLISLYKKDKVYVFNNINGNNTDFKYTLTADKTKDNSFLKYASSIENIFKDIFSKSISVIILNFIFFLLFLLILQELNIIITYNNPNIMISISVKLFIYLLMFILFSVIQGNNYLDNLLSSIFEIDNLLIYTVNSILLLTLICLTIINKYKNLAIRFNSL